MDSIECRDFVVIVALRTDLAVHFEILLPQRLLAAVALDPQPLGHDAPLIRRFHRLSLALEPGHSF